MKKRLGIFFIVFFSPAVFAVTLPTGLSPADVDRVVDIFGFGSAVRGLRAADAYPYFPGLKLGMEFTFIPTRNLNELGNRDGSMPSVLPTPRFYLAKGLFSNLELIVSVFPKGIINSLTSIGGMLKWTFNPESEKWAAAATYLAFTSVRSDDDNYFGNDFEFGALISKDLVQLKPFFGLGILLAKGTVNPAFTSTASNSSTRLALHAMAGFEIELPVNVTLQLDFFNLNAGGSFFIGKRF